MSNIEIKPGWWRMRNGEIVFVHCQSKRGGWMVEWKDGGPLYYEKNGQYYADELDECDLETYLPDCTGFDWKPEPKYVPFTRETVPLGAEVRATDGARLLIVAAYENRVYVGNCNYSYQYLLECTIDGKPAGRVVDE